MIIIIMVTCTHSFFRYRIWNWFAFFGIFLTVLSFVVTAIVGNWLTTFGLGMIGMLQQLYAGVAFTIIVITVSVVALIPEFIF